MKGSKYCGSMYVILVYDICVDNVGKKNLPKVYKTCKKYLIHIQNSVFEGEITEANLIKLREELKPCIRRDLDSVIVFKSRNSRWLDKMFWGKKDDSMERFL